ncbi:MULTISPECIES: NAD-dependent succinate-semialdehyde dehydrogenase [Allobranchiibius]|uniref:Succinate-semialdehyde dehydrogenase/glutarate-semialdehyde dehydrogenase n=1 Tax=Allobranchiibius huperziae TaxID=1874116 RepID=A0A853DNV5_9MICO|nr:MULTISPECIES: NAD-dependent succinate-semialdehyde dehydrogenase [Allobranchiibius]NYJ76441.1 succinate-semialdehyde dehydrogenase/glutarate-semialdehyde dehydrogenase [Allobranchiibius huperziae]UIJ35454.1 NAD-dependent succinate-semialdehyde dehydrogenase [Allobranchiibius sp. GilTou73]
MTSEYRTENPATGEVLKTFPELDEQGVKTALDAAETGYTHWRDTDAKERAAALGRTADLYEQRSDELAQTIAREMGKPLKQAAGEVALAAAIYRYYAEQGPKGLVEDTLDERSVVRKEPVGVLLGIMPWNFPYYQVARFVAPNLLLGNAVLLKHAPICAASALLMEEILHEAGVDKGAYQNIFASNDQVADMLADPRVQGVSLTGSERAGAAVAEAAGRNLKKAVLELGGSDPMIVLDSADVAKTSKIAARARLSNCGQACNSPKRMYVMADLYDDFVDGLTAQFEGSKVGDPFEDDTQVGPMSSASALDLLEEQVQDAIDKGATVRTGGKRLDRDGSFMAPTVLTDVTKDMRAYTEELFGPVAVVYKVASADEAVEAANASEFGLSGSVWTTDADKGRAVAERLDVGMAFVNEHGTTAPDLPFGGVKRSGYGRELAAYGMDEFVNKKLVRGSAK